ncbi:MAG: 4Fe-4S binding protein [Pseudomonadota bacterium]
MARKLLLCDCLGSQNVDAKSLSSFQDVPLAAMSTALCTQQSDRVAQALAAAGTDDEVVIACGQEWRRFEEIAEELGAPAPLCVDVRDRAGWSDESAQAGPKQAALLADALAPQPPLSSFDITSEGTCLILGAEAVALAAAAELADTLAVTVLLGEAPEAMAHAGAFDVVLGQLKGATGSLGRFELRFDALQEATPGGRGTPRFSAPQDGARSRCDVILDLRGQAPLFPAPEKRDGYLRADPGDARAVARAVLAASELTGTFEKPFHVTLAPELCAHSRAEQPACTRCLDICPTGAITPAGEHVSINPNVCAGCGACAALCPSNAIRAEDPPTAWLFGRFTRVARAFSEAGGTAPKFLIVDRTFGADMIALAARYGPGLPADVIPLDLERVSGFGHAEMLAALACGAARVDILVPPRAERDALDREFALAQALCGDPARLRLLEPADPDALCASLYGAEAPDALPEPVLAMGSRRQVARLASKALRAEMPAPSAEAPIPLPAGAPYGTVEVNTESCTLCLACASLCPSGALGDNPEMPQLRFQEDACLQCGLCVSVCPEDALSLTPQMDLSDAALSQRVLNEEEPFPCIECGKLFGSASTIKRITEKLVGINPLFADSDKGKLIQMCDDCRVRAQFHAQDTPFAAADRPRVRTTDDYLSGRRDH